MNKKLLTTAITLLLGMGIQPHAHADTTDGLVAHWSFDDCTAKDNSGNGHDGSINGNPQCVEGVRGKAFSFDGISSYVRVPNSNEINFGTTQDFTVSVWVNANSNQPDKGNSDNDIVEKWYAGEQKYPFVIRYNQGEIHSANYDGNLNQIVVVKSQGKINDGNFHLISLMKRGNSFHFYIDGQLNDEKTDSTVNDTANNSDLFIGCRGNFDAECYNKFKGEIDDLRIYNRALSEAEIKELYSGETIAQKPAIAPIYDLSQPLDNNGDLMDGVVEGQCVYGGYCDRLSASTAHNGVDYLVAKGSPVYAICDGTVKTATSGGDVRSRFTVIDHSNCGKIKKLFAYYGHLDPVVKKGAKVEAGQLIGRIADAKIPSLHLAISTKLEKSNFEYVSVGKSTAKDCKKETVTQRISLLKQKGWQDPIEVGAKSGWNAVLLKGGSAKTGCNAPEQVYEPAPTFGKTLPYAPWK